MSLEVSEPARQCALLEFAPDVHSCTGHGHLQLPQLATNVVDGAEELVAARFLKEARAAESMLARKVVDDGSTLREA